jgi:hypothetical protein
MLMMLSQLAVCQLTCATGPGQQQQQQQQKVKDYKDLMTSS